MARGEDVKTRMNLLLQESQKRTRLEDLRKDTLKKVDFIKRKAIIEYHEVYKAVRDFFKEFIEKRYEFTVTELRAELKKIYISNVTRQLISSILDNLEAIEYATVHYTRDDLVKILDDFVEAVNQLVRVHKGKKPLLERIKMMFGATPEPQAIIAELPAIETSDSCHVRIYTLVEKCYIALDRHNIRHAKAAYHALIDEYSRLDDGQKKEYYHLIDQTYNDILNRTKMIEK